MQRQTTLAQMDIRTHTKVQEQAYELKLQTHVEQAQQNFTSWVQVSRQQLLDATKLELKELRDSCFAEIDEEFEVHATALRSEMDCVRTHVKHVTREELELYKTTIRQYHTPPPATTIPTEDEVTHPQDPDDTHPNSNEQNDTTADATQPTDPPPARPRPPIPLRAPKWAPNVNLEMFNEHIPAPPERSRPTNTSPVIIPTHDTTSTPSTTASRDRYMDPEYQLATLRKTSPSMQLRGTTADDVLSFYNSFVDFLSSFRVPILHATNLILDEPVYPTDREIHPDLLQRYSAAIYTRLEEPGVLDQTISRYKGLIQQHNGTRDGYRVLQQLVRPYLDSHALTNIPIRPEYSTTDSIYTFAAALTKYFQAQRRRYRNYPRLEQAIIYLHGAINDSDYTEAARSLLYDLAKLKTTDILDPKFNLETLPGTLDAQRALITPPTAPPQGTRINAATTRDNNRRNNTRAYQNRPNNTHTPRTQHQPSTPREYNTGTGTRNPATPGTPRRTLEVQCEACGMYGHQDPSSCTFLPRVALCLDYIHQHDKSIKGINQAWRHRNNPTVKRLAREQVVKHLHVHLPDHSVSEIAQIARSIVDDDGDGTALRPIQLDQEEPDEPPPTESHHEAVQYNADDDGEPYDSTYGSYSTYQNRIQVLPRLSTVPSTATTTIRDEIQPILFPPRAFLPPTTPRTNIPTVHPPSVLIKHIVQIDSRKHHLADTGANFSVTDDPSFLHDYTNQTSYETTGYDGITTKATGHGIMKILNNFGKVECHTIIHSQHADGTIISVEHHAKTNPAIHKWEQTSIPTEYRGWITFYSHDNTVISQYDTIRHNGLYYITNLNIIPPPAMEPLPNNTNVHQTTTSPQVMTDNTIPTTPDNTSDDHHDTTAYDITLENDYLPGILLPTHSNTHASPTNTDDPICIHTYTAEAPTLTSPTPTPLEKDILTFEIWHQRLGHVSETKLRKTQQCAQGIPRFKTTALPTLIRCRICDIARLQKAPKGKPCTDPPDLVPGQMFQMDIGFFRGPSNLEAVVDRREDAKLKIIESRQGYVCYLLIVDRKTRKVWVFPLKSRSVPITLISMFLQLHGNSTPHRRWIRTDGEGSLAKSSTFRAELLQKFGYLVELTATDSSSQNSIAERPHRTFGIMVRCMLYASKLPMIFWADAYVYANYIYDRIHHTSIGTTPYEAWTGKQPTLSHMRVFGAHVIVKRSGPRPTKADPHYYDGNFLRFAATEKNIVYWDRHTKREKLARHCTIDEFHFGTKIRPPLAHGVMDLISPNKLPIGSHAKQEIIHLDDITGAIPTLHEVLPNYDAPLHNTAVAARLFAQLTPQQQDEEAIVHMQDSQSLYTDTVQVTLPLNRLPTLGLILYDDPHIDHPILRTCQEGTHAYRLPNWKSRIRGSIILRINDMITHTSSDVRQIITQLRDQKLPTATLTFATLEGATKDNTGVPQLHFDQLRHIHNLTAAPDKITNSQHTIQKPAHLTRKLLKTRPDFHLWKQSEFSQHDKYRSQGMFGDPIPKPLGAVTLPFVWTYILKEGKPKARATCNGGPRYGKAVTLAQTYANCVEQPACRLFWSLAAQYNYIVLGADAGNAFAEAPPPDQAFYMIIDDQYRSWWTEHLQRSPIPLGYVLPVNHALQGHPEAPRLWETHINTILTERLKFVPTTHEPCLYVNGDTPETKILFLRQVDDFAVAAPTVSQARRIITQIGENLIVPLNDLGQIQKFNGVNILQTRNYIKISCDDYLQKILTQHTWNNLPASQKPLPMQSSPQFHAQLEIPLQPLNPQQQQDHEKQAGFSYRAAIGELIYALITARPDISYCTTKLAQYSANPQPCHYNAVKQVFAYLKATQHHGIIYWRKTPRKDLPDITPDLPMSNNDHRTLPVPVPVQHLMAYTDSDWGSDRTHRRSVTGTVLLYSCATILYKTRYQPAIALSSTEAEFVAASDTGKSILYLRSLLNQLGYLPPNPTPMLVDNRGALYMVDSQAPTKRTRHVDIRYFALLQWQKDKHLLVIPVPTADNISDSLTKATGRIKFHQHTDIYMGRTHLTHGRSAAQRPTTHSATNRPSHSPSLTPHHQEVDSTGG
jgi:Reverse transcriptase (RNA-dependent DNA polymerase)